MNTAIQSATQSKPTTPIPMKIPCVTNLVIKGVKQENVNETRLGYLHTMTPAHASPATSNKRLAENSHKPKQHKKPEASFRLIETTDVSLGMVMIAKAISASLRKGETIVLVSPEKKDHLMRKLEMMGVEIESFISTRKLIITQLGIDEDSGQAINYRQAFGEIFKQANTVVDRIVIMEMDAVVNLESQTLAYSTISKFTQAADEMGCKVIAQYARNQSEEHDRLDAACSSLVNAYFVMKRGDEGRKYVLQGKNRPV